MPNIARPAIHQRSTRGDVDRVQIFSREDLLAKPASKPRPDTALSWVI
jgi:hypothetical protein